MNTPASTMLQIAVQVLPFIHIILACIATAFVLRKRSEKSLLLIVALLVAWLIPLFGPCAVFLGLRRPHAAQV